MFYEKIICNKYLKITTDGSDWHTISEMMLKFANDLFKGDIDYDCFKIALLNFLMHNFMDELVDCIKIGKDKYDSLEQHHFTTVERINQLLSEKERMMESIRSRSVHSLDSFNKLNIKMMQESLDSNKKIVELNHYITEQQIHAKTVMTRIDKMKTIITKLVQLIGDVLMK